MNQVSMSLQSFLMSYPGNGTATARSVSTVAELYVSVFAIIRCFISHSDKVTISPGSSFPHSALFSHQASSSLARTILPKIQSHSFTMIYHTTIAFIFTLVLIQISRALPYACGDHISPASESVQHRLLYGDGLHALVSAQPSMCDPKYDDPNGSMSTVACGDPLGRLYPRFGDIPTFPNIGGVFDVEPQSPKCGECLRLTNRQRVHIYFTVIDSAPSGIVMSVATCKALKVGEPGELIMIEKVPLQLCEFRPS